MGFDKLDARILPEMGVKVAFHQIGGATPAATQTLLVPKSALRQDGGRDVVMTVRNDVVERRAVTIGASNGDDVILSLCHAWPRRKSGAGRAEGFERWGAKVKEKKP